MSHDGSAAPAMLDGGMVAPAPQASRVAYDRRRTSLYERLCRLYELPQERQRSASVEGLRGLAVALVFFVHYHALFSDLLARGSSSLTASKLLWNIGHSGVDVFFVLSGALIYEVLLKRRQSYGGFLHRRVHRIFPCFVAVFCVYLVLLPYAPDGRVPDGVIPAAGYLVGNLLLLPGIFPIHPLISVAWSLSYEFAFYLVLPLLVYGAAFHTRSRRARVLWICAAAVVLIGLTGHVPHKRMLLFTSGMLLLEARNSPWFRSRLTRRGEFAVLLLLALSFPALITTSARPQGPNIWPWSSIAVLWVTYFWVVLYVTGFAGVLHRAFSMAGLRWLGNISYSYYLLHGLTLKILSVAIHRALPADAHSVVLFWLLMPVGFGVAFVVATVMFAAIEKPISLARRPVPVASGGTV